MSKLFDNVEAVEEFLTSPQSSEKLLNIWNNLQESLDTDEERVTFFNRVAAKQIQKQ